ncbi:hypothetical protein ACFE04_027189 [Oxalis oulophora]
MSRAGVSAETQMSIAASSMFPGFRFSPTDNELISYYLKKKLEGSEKCVEVISEVDFCKYEPWDLPARSIIQSENEWFFFCSRGRKYPNGSQSKRATELGYWKATGKERNVKNATMVIGTKRTLVFHVGRAPKGERTGWIMHEYCMIGTSQDSMVVCRLRKNSDFCQNEGSNQRLSNVHGSSSAAPNGSVEPDGTPEGDKAVECSSKRCSSSYDSHSIEQLDSASEAEQRLSNRATVVESSSHQKEPEDVDDFFADILKDDIIQLDETSFSGVPGVLPSIVSRPLSEMVRREPIEAAISQVAAQAVASHLLSSHEAATPRIKSNDEKAKISGPTTCPPKPDTSFINKGYPHCVYGLLASGKKKRWFFMPVILLMIPVVLYVAAFLLSWLCGRSCACRRFAHIFF